MTYGSGKEIMNFVCVETGFREVFEECWRVHEVMNKKEPAAGRSVDEPAPVMARAEVARAEVEEKTTKPKRGLKRGISDASAASSASGKKRKVGKGQRRVIGTAEKEAQKAKGKKMRDALDKVKKAKLAYNQALGGWGSTNKLIEEDATWDHAKGDKETLKAVGAAKRLEDLVTKDAFWATWVAKDANSLRKHYKDEEFIGMVAKKMDKLDKCVLELAEHLSTVTAMHNARPDMQPSPQEAKTKTKKVR